MTNLKRDSYIVNSTSVVLSKLKKVSLLELILCFYKHGKGSYAFVDTYVLINLVVAILSLILYIPPSIVWWE